MENICFDGLVQIVGFPPTNFLKTGRGQMLVGFSPFKSPLQSQSIVSPEFSWSYSTYIPILGRNE